MASVYLFCLILGGGLLLFSLFGGAESDGVEGGEAELGDGADTLAHDFFSVRALFYFLAGFGATGVLLTTLTAAGPTATLAWAVATGMVASGLAALLYGWLRRSDSGLLPLDDDHLAGLPARVLVPVRPGRRGKVVALLDGREVELLARLYGSADPECPRGATVVIVDIEGDTARVTPAAFLPQETD